MTPLRRRVVSAAVLLGMTSTLNAEVFLRWNQAGYTPVRPKSLVVMSDADLAGAPWRIVRAEATDTAVLEGRLEASVVGIGDHTPLPFNHVADFTALETPGRYRFVLGEGDGLARANLLVADDPYAPLRELPLRHLRVMRSGTDDVLLRRASHRGDASSPVVVPDGDPASGTWKPAEPARTVDALGGWYDAGDQIKFTLTIAHTSYLLLFAYRLDPDRWSKNLSRSDLPDILDEARHGLEFLVRAFPDNETFIIQVGDERDHEQEERLPEDDPLDGRRPALCALSRVHMGSAAAALALGARTFRDAGHTDDAERYARQAVAIYARARQPDTIKTAFERGRVNDFYHDPDDRDQMALAAAELHALTGERGYLEEAIALDAPAGGEVSWGEWNWLPNRALANASPAARQHLLAETGRYATTAAGPGRPWSVPGPYVWGSLHRWIGASNAARMTSLDIEPSAARNALFFEMLDYTLGRSSWGVAFLFCEELPNTVREIYSPAYHLLGAFPTGALSEGPGDRGTHDALAHHFGGPPDDPLARFDTRAAVFRDSRGDFMCQESTISGQADAVLLLTLATLKAAR